MLRILPLSCLATFVILCAVATADEPKESLPRPGVRCLTFSPDGKLLAAATGEPDERGEAIVWSVATRSVQVYHQSTEGIPSAAFAPNSKTLAIGGFTPVARLLSAESGEVLREFRGHEGHVRCVAFAGPDTLITGSYDKTLKVWNVRTGEVRATLKGHDERVQCIAVSPDGKTAVSTSPDQTARVWDLATGSEKRVLYRAAFYLTTVAAVGEGDLFLTGCFDGQARIHELGSDRLRATVRCSHRVDCAQLSRDGLLAVASPSPFIQLYAMDAHPPEGETTRKVEQLIVALDNDDSATRDASERELTGIGYPADSLLRTASQESRSAEVRIRARRIREAIRSPEPLATLKGHEGIVQYVCFSPDGKLLASGDERGEVKLWDVSRGASDVQEIATLTRPNKPGEGEKPRTSREGF